MRRPSRRDPHGPMHQLQSREARAGMTHAATAQKRRRRRRNEAWETVQFVESIKRLGEAAITMSEKLRAVYLMMPSVRFPARSISQAPSIRIPEGM